LIKDHETLEQALPFVKNAQFPVEPQRIREIFLKPPITDDYVIEWKEPDVEALIRFIVGERDFSEDRVRKTLEKMQAGAKKIRGKTTLEQWFS
jgi:flap endonuclease-1